MTAVTVPPPDTVEIITDPNHNLMDNWVRLRKVPRAMRNFSYFMSILLVNFVRRAQTGNDIQEITT